MSGKAYFQTDKNKRKSEQLEYASEEDYDSCDGESDDEEELKEFEGITLTSIDPTSDDIDSTTSSSTTTSANKGATHYTEEESNLLLECVERKKQSFIPEEDEAIVNLVQKHTEPKPNWTPTAELYNSKAPKKRSLDALKARYYLMKKGGGIKFWDLKKKRLLEICVGCLIERRDGDEVCWSKARQLFNTEFECNKSRSIIRSMWKLMKNNEEWKQVIEDCIKGELVTPDDGKRFKMQVNSNEENQPVLMSQIEELIEKIKLGSLVLGESSPFEERIAFRILVSDIMEDYYSTNQCKRISETSFHKLFSKYHDPREELERFIGHPCDEKFGVTKACKCCQYFRPCHEATCMQCHYRHQCEDSNKGQIKECYYKSRYANNWLWYYVLRNPEFKEGSIMNPLDVDSLDDEKSIDKIEFRSNEIFKFRKAVVLHDTMVDLNIAEEVKKIDSMKSRQTRSNSIMIDRLVDADIVLSEYKIKEEEMEEDHDIIIDCDEENDDTDEVLVNNLTSGHYQRIMDRTDLKLSWLNDFVKDDHQNMSDWVCDHSINIVEATNQHRYECL